jgi:hypothetical protein
MALIKAQVTYPYRTNLPKDVATNTFWFYTDGAGSFEGDCTIIAAALTEFLEDVYTQGISSYINTNLISCNFYDMSQAPPRVPYTVLLTPGGLVTNATIVPTEVACVLSFEALPASGQVQARRRGRVYLPGIGAALQWTASSATAPYFPRFAPAFLTTVTTAAETLATTLGIGGSPGLYWGVYSQTTESLSPVVQGWVDESPDTQRRRSVDATTRTLWNVA